MKGLEFGTGKVKIADELRILTRQGNQPLGHFFFFPETGIIKVQDELVRSETKQQASRSEYK